MTNSATSDEDAALWHLWTSKGVTIETQLTVDYFFYSRSEHNARSLATALERSGLRATVHPKRTFLVFRGWLVQAKETASGWSLSRLRQRTSDMEALASTTGMLYDGCGAEMP